MKFLFQGENVI